VQRVLEVGVGDLRDERAVAGRQVGEEVERAREPLERRLHLGVERILLERAAQGLVGAVRIVEADLVAVGDEAQQVDLLLGVDGVTRLDLVDADEVRPVAAIL
jgi:hypothetical protein